jgi:hypothetical protein
MPNTRVRVFLKSNDRYYDLFKSSPGPEIADWVVAKVGNGSPFRFTPSETETVVVPTSSVDRVVVTANQDPR